MTIETPASGILKCHDTKNSTCYHIECDCHDSEHAVKMWIEVDSELGSNVAVNFYVNAWIPFWENGFNRIKIAWLVLTKGFYHQEHTLLLTKQSALNLAAVINEKVKELDQE